MVTPRQPAPPPRKGTSMAGRFMQLSMMSAGAGVGYLARRAAVAETLADVFPNVSERERQYVFAVPFVGIALFARLALSGWTADSSTTAPGRMLEAILRNAFILGLVFGGLYSQSSLDVDGYFVSMERAGTCAVCASGLGVAAAAAAFQALELYGKLMRRGARKPKGTATGTGSGSGSRTGTGSKPKPGKGKGKRA